MTLKTFSLACGSFDKCYYNINTISCLKQPGTYMYLLRSIYWLLVFSHIYITTSYSYICIYIVIFLLEVDSYTLLLKQTGGVISLYTFMLFLMKTAHTGCVTILNTMYTCIICEPGPILITSIMIWENIK